MLTEPILCPGCGTIQLPPDPCPVCTTIQSIRFQVDSISDERFRYRAALEQLITDIRPNLGTHDHTDWGLRRMVDRAEEALNYE